jgi:hypothetical protein
MIRERVVSDSRLMRPIKEYEGHAMLSVARIAALCEEIGTGLQDGENLRHRTIDAATALFLAVGSLERALAHNQPPTHVPREVREDLERARTLLLGIEAVAQTAAADELRREVLEARSAILNATSALLGVAG